MGRTSTSDSTVIKDGGVGPRGRSKGQQGRAFCAEVASSLMKDGVAGTQDTCGASIAASRRRRVPLTSRVTKPIQDHRA